MPNQRTVYGGATLVEGIFLGHDDAASFSHIVHSTVHAGDDADHVVVHGVGGELDQGLIEGPLVVRFDDGVEDILQGDGHGKVFDRQERRGACAQRVRGAFFGCEWSVHLSRRRNFPKATKNY